MFAHFAHPVCLPTMRLSFTKMHGLGNDFIVFDAPAEADLPSAAAAAPPRRPPHRHRFRSGAGAAAAARGRHRRVLPHLQCRRLRGRAMRQRRALHRQPGRAQARTQHGAHGQPRRPRRRGELRDDGWCRVDMGVPNFDPASLPFEASREADIYPLRVGEQELQIGAVSMGNPHAVIQVPSVRDARRGHSRPRGGESFPLSEAHQRRLHGSRQPGSHPVARVRTRRRRDAGVRHRRMRRGGGRTPARVCCTKKCRSMRPGGGMIVRWPGPGEHLWLTGPAVSVFEGTVDVRSDDHA